MFRFGTIWKRFNCETVYLNVFLQSFRKFTIKRSQVYAIFLTCFLFLFRLYNYDQNPDARSSSMHLSASVSKRVSAKFSPKMGMWTNVWVYRVLLPASVQKYKCASKSFEKDSQYQFEKIRLSMMQTIFKLWL